MAQPQPLDPSLKLAELDHVPLFMRSLPDEENEYLSALQSLVHDGTPDEIAENFKNQGNEYFKGKRYREALGFYSQGIDAEPEDKALKEALLCNRAASNLELKNYGSVLRDCSTAIGINSRCSKAFYRSAMALNALERYDEALDCCDLCLGFDPENDGVKKVRDAIVKARERRDRKEREKAEKIMREKEERRLLNLAFKERHLSVAASPENAAPNPFSPHFDPEDPTKSTLIFPVFFLYPQYATSDTIPTYVETTPFSAHLAVMFPPDAPKPDWDKAGEYRNGNLAIYTITKRKRLLKVGIKKSLVEVFEQAAKDKDGKEDWLEVKEGCLSFVVLPKGVEETKWIEEFKRSRELDKNR